MITFEKVINDGTEAIKVVCELTNYFSITGTIGRKRESGERGETVTICGKDWIWESGGCIHDDILKHFPELADIVPLHLADKSGIPMHAIDNGHYHLQNLETCAKYMRVSLDELTAALTTKGIADKMKFSAWVVNDLCPRWAQEAAAAIEKYKLG